MCKILLTETPRCGRKGLKIIIVLLLVEHSFYPLLTCSAVVASSFSPLGCQIKLLAVTFGLSVVVLVDLCTLHLNC